MYLRYPDVRLVGLKFLYIAMMETYSDFRGLEQVMYDIYEEPEMLHEAMAIMEEGYNGLLDQYLEQGLLTCNGNQAYSGSGGQTYTHEIPNDDSVCTDLKNFFGMTESQEFTMVGPEQHWGVCTETREESRRQIRTDSLWVLRADRR